MIMAVNRDFLFVELLLTVKNTNMTAISRIVIDCNCQGMFSSLESLMALSDLSKCVFNLIVG